jgi:hypothetical protein
MVQNSLLYEVKNFLSLPKILFDNIKNLHFSGSKEGS